MSSQHKASFLAYVGATGLAAVAVVTVLTHTGQPSAEQQTAGGSATPHLPTLPGQLFRQTPPATASITPGLPIGASTASTGTAGTGRHIVATPATARPSQGSGTSPASTSTGGTRTRSTSGSTTSHPASAGPARASSKHGKGKGRTNGNGPAGGSGHHGKAPTPVPVPVPTSTPLPVPVSTPTSVSAGITTTAVSPYVTHLTRWNWLLPGTETHVGTTSHSSTGHASTTPRRHAAAHDCARGPIPGLFGGQPGKHAAAPGPSHSDHPRPTRGKHARATPAATAHTIGITTQAAPGRHSAKHSHPAAAHTGAPATSSHPASHPDHGQGRHARPDASQQPGRHSSGHTDTPGHANLAGGRHAHGSDAAHGAHGHHSSHANHGHSGHGGHGHGGHGLDGIGWH